MQTSNALEFFGQSKKAIAEAVGITSQAVSQWGELVPLLSALKLVEASGGKLALNRDEYKHGGHVPKEPLDTGAALKTA